MGFITPPPHKDDTAIEIRHFCRENNVKIDVLTSKRGGRALVNFISDNPALKQQAFALLTHDKPGFLGVPLSWESNRSLLDSLSELQRSQSSGRGI